MLRPLRLIALLALIATPAAIAVAPPPRPLGPPEVQALIDQLGHRDYRLRELAERRLWDAGMTALPLLRKAMGHTDPEIRRRAFRLVPGLEHAALVMPKRVTLTTKNQPIRVILEELSKQSGYKIHHMGVMNPQRNIFGGFAGLLAGAAAPKETTYSYTFVNETFWTVLQRLSQDANLILQQGYGDDAIRLYQTDGSAPHIGQDGAFFYSAMNLQMYRNVDLTAVSPKAGSFRQESLTFNFALFSEPRLPFLGMGEVRIEAAYDNERNSMIPKVAGDPNDPSNMGMMGGVRFTKRYYNGGYKQSSIQASLMLERISEKATTIKQLRGIAPVTLLVEQKPVDLAGDNFLATKGKKSIVGDLEFNIESVTKKPNQQYDVKFTVTNKGNANDYTWQNTLYQRLELLDAKGGKYQNWGSNWHGGGGNNMSMTMTYNGNNGAAKVGEPTRFVFQQWKTKQHDVYFEFKNVPLP